MKHIHMHVNKHFRNNSEKLTKNANGILALSLCVRVFFLLFLFYFPQMKQMKNEMNEMKLQAITYVTVLDCDSTMLSHHILCHMYVCEWEWGSRMVASVMCVYFRGLEPWVLGFSWMNALDMCVHWSWFRNDKWQCVTTVLGTFLRMS